MSNLQRSDPTGLPPWLVAVRKIAADVVKESDIREIITKQLELAKKGDQRAARFVLDYLNGGNLRGITLVQNFFGDEGDPRSKTQERPGTAKKIKVMQRRVASGMPANNEDDNDEVSLD